MLLTWLSLVGAHRTSRSHAACLRRHTFLCKVATFSRCAAPTSLPGAWQAESGVAAPRYIAGVPTRHPLLVALEPVAAALGATLVTGSGLQAGDIPLVWEGETVGGLRLPGVQGTLDRLVKGIEAELGSPLAELSREDKQRAVRMLDEQGAFRLRRAVEEVAEVLGVSRFTVYNYLNAGPPGSPRS
jgi:hypothetical protein